MRKTMKKTRPELLGGAYKPLSNQDIKAIHEATLKVFAEIGIRVNNPEVINLYKSAGAKWDEQENLLFLEPEIVTDLIGKAPAKIKLYGQKQEHTLDVYGTKVYPGTGGTALDVLEPGQNKKRRATLEDLKNLARVVEELKHISFYMLPVLPSDVNARYIDVNRFGVALSACSKHIMGGVYSKEGIHQVIKMASMIAGSYQDLQDKPIVSMVTCCGLSPFSLDTTYSNLTIEVAKTGIPVVTPVEPLCGATAPATLAGNLVVQNVDTLAGIMITQIVNPGTPVFYGCISSIVDMKDMKYLSGAVEMGLMSAAASQLAQFYEIPIYTTAGMSDSKTLDAQAGFESSITNLLVALAGGNIIHDAAGLMDFCLCASLEKLVIDDEILGMVMRAVKGIEVNKETLALDVLKQVGPGGQFVTARHTRENFRKECFFPQIANRDKFEDWLDKGGLDTRAKARQKVEEILTRPFTSYISDHVRNAILKEIPGIHSKHF